MYYARQLYSESDGSADEGVKSTDDEFMEQNQYLDLHKDLDAEDDHECELNGLLSESNGSCCSDTNVNKVCTYEAITTWCSLL